MDVLRELDRAPPLSFALNLLQWPGHLELQTGQLLLFVLWIFNPWKFYIGKIFPEPRKAIFMCLASSQCKICGPSGNLQVGPAGETLMCMTAQSKQVSNVDAFNWLSQLDSNAHALCRTPGKPAKLFQSMCPVSNLLWNEWAHLSISLHKTMM